MSLIPQLECIPNVSEGRDLAIIDKLTTAITSVPGTKLLHRDIGFDANRTVFTFVGDVQSVSLSAKQLARACRDLIDLRKYQGTHPYIGALDVCPFVSLWGLSPKHAKLAALDVANYSAIELGVPVYLYEHSATTKKYRSLANVRRGGIVAAAAREGKFGPSMGQGIHPTAGASVVGARDILVAYNINLSVPDVGLAQNIAQKTRASNKMTGLAKVRAIGWMQPQLGFAQVSINLLDYRVTSMATVYEAVKSHARQANADVAGSELIGLLPLAALGENPEQAVLDLGLGVMKAFVLKERVLEWVGELSD